MLHHEIDVSADTDRGRVVIEQGGERRAERPAVAKRLADRLDGDAPAAAHDGNQAVSRAAQRLRRVAEKVERQA